ncbi:cytochrome C oxidase subunit II [archaeon]|nr:cytochrome C oxidase subunit II [archaeon]|tara:strand:+ start:1119 stop:1517 length:399 start_codon:yes stop_codon:yes gene_type:complete
MKKILLILVLLFFVAGCGDINEGSNEPNQNSDVPDVKDTQEVKEFVMTAKQFDFVPGRITVNKGDRVRLKITSVDVKHGFSLSEFGINRDLEVDKQEVIEFVADKVGEFKFRCSVFCGSGHGGMEGVLIVNG